jgi:transcription antitermination factor NusG
MATLSWFALFVKSKHEKNVSAMLHGESYEAFLPAHKDCIRHNRTVELPLFPTHVLCRFEPQNRLPVITAPGVFSIVTGNHGLEPIAEHEIETIQRMLNMPVAPVPWRYVVPGDTVLVESGPFRGFRGVVTDSSDGKWLIVSLNLLRGSVAVRLDRDSLSVKVDATSRYTSACSQAGLA